MVKWPPRHQGKIIRSFVEDNVLRMWRGFSYNPNVFRDRMIPGGRISGCTGIQNRRTESQRGETGM